MQRERRSGSWLFLATLFLFLAFVALAKWGPATVQIARATGVDSVAGEGVDDHRFVTGTQPSAPDIFASQAGDEIRIVVPAGNQVVGAPFRSTIDITAAPNAYQGYQVAVQYDPNVINFVPTDDLSGDTVPDSWHYTGLGGMTFDVTVFDVGGNPAVKGGGSALISGATNATGTAIESTWVCVGSGTTSLHLVTLAEDPFFGSTTIIELPTQAPTTLADTQVTCQEGAGPAPTATPSEGATPVATPVGPSMTPTPLPPGMEVVPLVGGCQFVAWTGADATSAADLAAHVGPAGNLLSLWAQQPPPTWRGYSPEFPQVSDMGPVNTLDVVAICMAGAGDFVRPVL